MAVGFDLVDQFSKLREEVGAGAPSPLGAYRPPQYQFDPLNPQQYGSGPDFGALVGQPSGQASGPSGAYSSSMLASAADVAARFGIRNPGGYRERGSVANSDHPKWRAYDFMTGSDKTKGWGIANYMVQQAGKYNVKYVIFDNKIWKPGKGWSQYTHPHGSTPTLRHEDHVHVSYY